MPPSHQFSLHTVFVLCHSLFDVTDVWGVETEFVKTESGHFGQFAGVNAAGDNLEMIFEGGSQNSCGKQAGSLVRYL